MVGAQECTLGVALRPVGPVGGALLLRLGEESRRRLAHEGAHLQPRELTLEEFMACFGISWVDEEEVRSASYYEFMNAFGLMPVDNTMNELAPVLDGNLFQRARRARLLQELCEAGEGMMQ